MNKKNEGLPPSGYVKELARDHADRVLSTELLGRSGRLIIEHNGEDYVLRITRSGKLILTK